MHLALIDHYDSFTFNVLDWLAGPADESVVVTWVAYDDADGLAAVERQRLPLVLSPGPKHPADAPATLALIKRSLGRVPILGICLGHQLLAYAEGARVERAAAPFHGTQIEIQVATQSILAGDVLAGCPPTFGVATYNSLVAVEETLPAHWQILARSVSAGEVQAIARRRPGEAPAFGLQFHPDSFLSENSDLIRRNWLAAAAWR